jgi:hypothetical protein
MSQEVINQKESCQDTIFTKKDKVNGNCSTLTKEELHNVYKIPDILKIIKSGVALGWTHCLQMCADVQYRNFL